MRLHRFLLLLLATACDAGDARDPDVAGDTLVAEPLALIGEIEGADEYVFGGVWSVALDSSGRIYVADGMGSEVLAYSPNGEFVARVARRGEGPGEVTHPSDLLFDDEGRLWIRDASRATVLAPRTPGGLPDSVASTRPFHGYTNWTAKARSRVVDDIYYYPHYLFRTGEPERYFYLGYGPDGPSGDTLEVPPYETLQGSRAASYRTSPRGGRMVHGLNRAPFEPSAAWTITPRGTVLGGAGLSTVLETDGAFDTLRVIEVRPRRAVDPAEAEDSLAALRARIDSLPVPLEQVEGVSGRVRQGVLPDSVPGYVAVHVAADGRIWIRRWPPGAAGSTFFDVHAPDGGYLHTVRIPAAILDDPPPFFTGDRLVAVVEDPETGIHRVALFGIGDGAGRAESPQ